MGASQYNIATQAMRAPNAALIPRRQTHKGHWTGFSCLCDPLVASWVAITGQGKIRHVIGGTLLVNSAAMAMARRRSDFTYWKLGAGSFDKLVNGRFLHVHELMRWGIGNMHEEACVSRWLRFATMPICTTPNTKPLYTFCIATTTRQKSYSN